MVEDPAILKEAGFQHVKDHATPGSLHDHEGRPACVHGAPGTIHGALYLLPEKGFEVLDALRPALPNSKCALTLIPSLAGPAWAWHAYDINTPAISHGDWIAHVGPTML